VKNLLESIEANRQARDESNWKLEVYETMAASVWWLTQLPK